MKSEPESRVRIEVNLVKARLGGVVSFGSLSRKVFSWDLGLGEDSIFNGSFLASCNVIHLASCSVIHLNQSHRYKFDTLLREIESYSSPRTAR